MRFTKQQIEDWRAYEKVRLSGAYNMFDPRAKDATGLDRIDYLFVLKNYSEMKEKAEKKGKGAKWAN